jgi:hypothetical protein
LRDQGVELEAGGAERYTIEADKSTKKKTTMASGKDS